MKKRFKNSLEKVLLYLEGEFGLLVAQKYAQVVSRKFSTSSQQPHIGRRSATLPNIRSIPAGRQNRIYYRIEGNNIIVVNMYDTTIKPGRNKLE